MKTVVWVTCRKNSIQPDSVHSGILVSTASILCAVIVWDPMSISLLYRDLTASRSPTISCYLVRSVLTGSRRSVQTTSAFAHPVGLTPCISG